MQIRILFFLGCLMGASALSAQFRGGVKTGLNFSTIKGTPETDGADASLESVDSYTGFHIGPSFAYNFTDRFGVRGEFLYSKKGAKYNYSGPFSRVFTLESNQTMVPTVGAATMNIVVNHVSLDIPVMAYTRLGDIELSAGGYLGIILLKTGEGALQYTWAQQPGTSGGSMENFLDYNYNRDEAGESKGTETISVPVQKDPNGNKNAVFPQIFGAYYEHKEDRGNLYRSIDYGLIGGVSYFFSRSLFIGARLQYGLADLTNTNADLSVQSINQTTPVTRNDKDYNFTIQASLGFSF